MAEESGKYLYYCTSNGTSCIPLYKNKEELEDHVGYTGVLGVKYGSDTFYIPMSSKPMNSGATLNINSNYLYTYSIACFYAMNSNGARCYVEFEKEYKCIKIGDDHHDTIVWGQLKSTCEYGYIHRGLVEMFGYGISAGTLFGIVDSASPVTLHNVPNRITVYNARCAIGGEYCTWNLYKVADSDVYTNDSRELIILCPSPDSYVIYHYN